MPLDASEITTSVMGPDHRAAVPVLRAAKAAYLYGDSVKLFASFVPFLAERGWYTGVDKERDPVFLARQLLGWPNRDFPPDREYLELADQYWGIHPEAESDALRELFAGLSRHVELMPEAESIQAFTGLMRGSWDSDALGVPVVDVKSVTFLQNIFCWTNAIFSGESPRAFFGTFCCFRGSYG